MNMNYPEFVQFVGEEIYGDLILSPLWTLAALHNLQDTDLTEFHIRHSLIAYLVKSKIPDFKQKYPNYPKPDWKVIDFKPYLEKAIKRCTEIYINRI